MVKNKGQTTLFMFFGLVVVFVYLIFIITLGIISYHMNSVLSQDIQIGQVNLQTLNAQTFGIYNSMIINNADFWGIAVIFGMIFGLFLFAYFTRNTGPKIGIILDIFFIVIVFVVSLYLSAAYSTVVVALSSGGEDFAINSLEKTSYFMLNLPLFVAIIGVIMMVLFHAGIPRKTEENRVITDIAM